MRPGVKKDRTDRETSPEHRGRSNTKNVTRVGRPRDGWAGIRGRADCGAMSEKNGGVIAASYSQFDVVATMALGSSFCTIFGVRLLLPAFRAPRAALDKAFNMAGGLDGGNGRLAATAKAGCGVYGCNGSKTSAVSICAGTTGQNGRPTPVSPARSRPGHRATASVLPARLRAPAPISCRAGHVFSRGPATLSNAALIGFRTDFTISPARSWAKTNRNNE